MHSQRLFRICDESVVSDKHVHAVWRPLGVVEKVNTCTNGHARRAGFDCARETLTYDLRCISYRGIRKERK